MKIINNPIGLNPSDNPSKHSTKQYRHSSIQAYYNHMFVILAYLN